MALQNMRYYYHAPLCKIDPFIHINRGTDQQTMYKYLFEGIPMCSDAFPMQEHSLIEFISLWTVPQHRPRLSRSCSRRRHTLWNVWERVPLRDRLLASLLGAWMVGLQLPGKLPSRKLTMRSVADHYLVVMIREFLIWTFGSGIMRSLKLNRL